MTEHLRMVFGLVVAVLLLNVVVDATGFQRPINNNNNPTQQQQQQQQQQHKQVLLQSQQQPLDSGDVAHYDALRVAYDKVEALYRAARPVTPTPTATATPTSTPTPVGYVPSKAVNGGVWGTPQRGVWAVPVLTANVDDEGTVPEGGTYAVTQATAFGESMGYNHRVGTWDGVWEPIGVRMTWMRDANNFPFNNKYFTVPPSEASTGPEPQMELREVIATRPADLNLLSATVEETSSSGGDSGNNTDSSNWSFTNTRREYEMVYVDPPKVKTVAVGSVDRYVGILQLSRHWTGNPVFDKTPRTNTCPRFFAYNCVQYNNPDVLLQPTPTPPDQLPPEGSKPTTVDIVAPVKAELHTSYPMGSDGPSFGSGSQTETVTYDYVTVPIVE